MAPDRRCPEVAWRLPGGCPEDARRLPGGCPEAGQVREDDDPPGGHCAAIYMKESLGKKTLPLGALQRQYMSGLGR